MKGRVLAASIFVLGSVGVALALPAPSDPFLLVVRVGVVVVALVIAIFFVRHSYSSRRARGFNKKVLQRR
jgi:hypothetical protein